MGEFNENLKRIRKEKGITQDQLANAVGVSAQAVSKWEAASYPDGAILPQIADFLGVTIDELYGRADETISMETRVMRYLRKLGEEKIPAAMFEICRSMFYVLTNEKTYLPSSKEAKESWISVSQMALENMWAQMQQTTDFEYFVLLPETKCGYDKYLKYDERFVEMFKFLAMPNALKAMYYLSNESTMTFFTLESLVTKLSITKENAGLIIEGMLKNDFVWQANINKGDDSEKIYQYIVDGNFLQFMTFAKVLLDRPRGFCMQMHRRSGESTWFKNRTYK